MNQDSLQELIRSGLPTLKAGGRVAANAADEISTSATDPELRSFLETGNDTAEQWQARVDRAMQEAGASEEGENEILEAHYRVSKQIRDAAPDDQVRDLGIKDIYTLCEWLTVEVIELSVQADHIHLVCSIPPKLSVPDFMGFLKGKLAIKLFKSYPELRKKPYWGNHFWTRGYFVNTVGINEDLIRRYVKY